MRFVLVNGRAPRPQSSCAFCCQPIGNGYLRELTTRLSYCNQQCYFGHSELSAPAVETATRESWGMLTRMSSNTAKSVKSANTAVGFPDW